MSRLPSSLPERAGPLGKGLLCLAQPTSVILGNQGVLGVLCRVAGRLVGRRAAELLAESGDIMPVIDDTAVIARPAGRVFGFLVHAGNLPRWGSRSWSSR
jgi:hypothetical protein